VNIKTAIKEDKCNAVIKNKSGLSIIFWNNARWPELETGRNSVIA
jgi:hypothetical protein